jgi:N-acetylglucosaminyldiphosphoundecaprenol N-acetyl-beta-D-mannosaminyltransferase
MSRTRARVRFLGVPVDPLDMGSTVSAIEGHIARGEPGAHLGVNAANLVLARDDAAYLADLSAAEIISAVGQSVVWGARLFGLQVPERVTGIDLMELLLATALSNDWGVYLVGARREVVDAVARHVTERGVRVAGHRDGYFSMTDAPEVVAAVRESGATLLFVGMPSPHKEQFIVHHARPAGVPFSVGVGGSFDVLAGEIRRAPRLMQQIGLEWLFRLVQEPRRLFGRYALTNTRFILLMITGASRRRWRA